MINRSVSHFTRVTRIGCFSSTDPAASLSPSGLEDVPGGNLDEDLEIHGDNEGTSTSSRWKKLWSKFECYFQLLLERDELEIFSSFNGLLCWLLILEWSRGTFFTNYSDDQPTSGVTLMRNRIVLIEKQTQAKKQSLNAREFELLV